jgi:predicted NBD/HSP70 family sugar kinase
MTSGAGAPWAAYWTRDSPGAVLSVLRELDRAVTINELAGELGMSRTATRQRLDLLLEADLVTGVSQEAATGGRPAGLFQLNRKRGVVLIADAGATGVRFAVCDLVAEVLDELEDEHDITDGPEVVLGHIRRRFDELLARNGLTPADVLAVGIDVPGPVDHQSGRVVNPPIMTGWHDYHVPGVFSDYACPVVVEKDANAMAIGEQRAQHPDTANLVFVKLGTGIGTGLVLQGRIYRGEVGAAGDVGHIPFAQPGKPDDPDVPLCRCGNVGCIEAYAGGWALVRDLTRLGHDVRSVSDLARTIERRDPDTRELMRTAGHIIGTAVSDLVSILNPRTVVVGGRLAAADDRLMAMIRETVYHRALPLATRELAIVASTLGEHAGVLGLAHLAIDRALHPATVDALVAGL